MKPAIVTVILLIISNVFKDLCMVRASQTPVERGVEQ